MKKISKPCILYLSTENSNQRHWNTYISLLSAERKKRVNNAPFNHKPLLFFSELLVKFAASNLLEINFDQIKISFDSQGKPYFPDFPDLHFNVSHSNEIVTVFISDTPVGIDIEYIDSPNLKIAERFFHDAENKYIFSDIIQKHTRFYEVWTRKEAYIKFLGKGLAVPLRSFNVFDKNLDPFFKTFYIDNYVLSSFHKGQEISLNPIKITESDVCSIINKNQ